MVRRWLSVLLLAALVLPVVGSRGVSAQDTPDEITVDYAYYNPSSLVLKKFGWLEEEFAADETEIKWVLSAGSNKANEYLRSEAADLASTAGSAALLARTNGSPIRTVYIYSKPEWSALVVLKDSEIASIEDLKGKKVAATKGTDPYFFLLQSLHSVGMTASDIEVVNLQHADGKVALERGQVDAWSGLDPFMAQTELEQGSKLIYRNIDFNTYGFLNAREEFIDEYPEATTRILEQYERARLWILDNPEEAAQILADEAKLSLDVAKLELNERTVLTESPIPGEKHATVLENIIPIFEAENQLTPGSDPHKSLEELLEPRFIEEVVAAAESQT